VSPGGFSESKLEQPADEARVADLGASRLRQFWGYARQVFSLVSLLDGIRDCRQQPDVSTPLVARILFLVGLLRIRSFNALEPKLAEAPMLRILDAPLRRCGKVCAVDTLSYSLARMEVASCRHSVVSVIRHAERNKAFREGFVGALRCVAIDGWEMFSSRSRCCDHCLTRELTIDGEKVTEYYHRYVVALLVDERLEVVLGVEPVRSADARKEVGESSVAGHEGELTAGKRLVRWLRTTYGRWIDVIIGDALYANGPFFTLCAECGYGALTVVKKETDEPLKEALAIWRLEAGPEEVVVDQRAGERIRIWDCPELTTLGSYKGSIRVVRATIHKDGVEKPTTYCFAATGKAAKLPRRSLVRLGRSRWHIENTAFHQWTKHWHFTHVFAHSANGVDALLWIFVLAFNLLQFFLYRQLRCYGRDCGKDVTRTIIRLVEEMKDDLARLTALLPWDST
jgi:hypothetical protein